MGVWGEGRGWGGEVNNEGQRFVGLQPRRATKRSPLPPPSPPDPIDPDLINHSVVRKKKKTTVSAVAPSPPLLLRAFLSPMTSGLFLPFSRRRTQRAESKPLRTAQNGSLLFRNYRDVGSHSRERGRRTRGGQEGEGEEGRKDRQAGRAEARNGKRRRRRLRTLLAESLK